MMRSLPVPQWPPALQAAWAEACRPAQRLRKGGRAAHLRPVGQAEYARHLGYLLQFLQDRGQLHPGVPLGKQITPEVIEGYLDCARLSWGSVMLSRNLYKLHRAANLMGAGEDLVWLKEMEADLHAAARPRDLSSRLVTTDRLVKAGLALTQRAESATSLQALKRACLYRNGLMIALLALCPIRLKNFTQLTLGTSLRRVGNRWWIILTAEDTKTGRPDERPVPKWLDPVLDRYLTFYRPILLGSSAGQNGAPSTSIAAGPLWVSSQGGTKLSYSAVGVAILETTQEAIGVAVNPHAFRTAAATTAAYRARGEPRLGSALLHHTDPRVTEEHYNRASMIDAVLSFGDLVRGLSE